MPASDWKQEISQLVATRRTRPENPAQATPATGQPDRTAAQERAERAARIAAAVAARYADAPTFSECLLQQQSAAEKEIPQPAHSTADSSADTSILPSAAENVVEDEGPANHDLPFEPLLTPQINARILLPNLPERPTEMTLQAPETEPEPTLDDLLAASWMTPPVPLPANLIQFPRELVASRRARPKLAEGPLRVSRSTSAEAAQAQLRIFEVDPDIDPVSDGRDRQDRQHEPAATAAPAAPAEEPENAACASIYLGAQPEPARYDGVEASDPLPLPLPAAAFHRRLMAFSVDFSLITGAFFAFLFIFALSTPHLPTGKPAVIMSGIVYLALWLLYQFLFFTLSSATAGMSYARIALCTFEDENPSRRSLQRRIVAWWIAALPLGLGFAWTLLDEDRLGWHDRMTRMYPRSY